MPGQLFGYGRSDRNSKLTRGLGSEKDCHRWEANQFRLFLHMGAYWHELRGAAPKPFRVHHASWRHGGRMAACGAGAAAGGPGWSATWRRLYSRTSRPRSNILAFSSCEPPPTDYDHCFGGAADFAAGGAACVWGVFSLGWAGGAAGAGGCGAAGAAWPNETESPNKRQRPPTGA